MLTLQSGDTVAFRYPPGDALLLDGMHENLDVGMTTALLDQIVFIRGRSALSPDQAYQLCSLAVDFT